MHGGSESVNVGRCYPEDDEPAKLGSIKQDHIICPPEQLLTRKSPSPIQRTSSCDHVSPDNKLLAPPDTHVEGLPHHRVSTLSVGRGQALQRPIPGLWIRSQSLEAGHQPGTRHFRTGSVQIPGRTGERAPISGYISRLFATWWTLSEGTHRTSSLPPRQPQDRRPWRSSPARKLSQTSVFIFFCICCRVALSCLSFRSPLRRLRRNVFLSSCPSGS